MTEYSTLVVEQDGPILWVRINRPEAMNAYTATMGHYLAGQPERVPVWRMIARPRTGVHC